MDLFSEGPKAASNTSSETVDLHAKQDLSGRSHDQPTRPRSLLKDGLIILGGAHPEMVREGGPKNEAHDFIVRGTVLLGSTFLTAITVTTILHSAVGDHQFHPLFGGVGLLAGAMQGAIDNVVQYRGTLQGTAELRRVGTKLPEPQKNASAIALKTVRAFQATAIGALAGLGMVLVAMAPGIDAYQTQKFINDNPSVYVEGAKTVDAGIARTRENLNSISAHVDQTQKSLTALQQSDVRRQVQASRRKRTTSPSGSNGLVALLENDLATGTAKRDALTKELSRQVANRNTDIERIVLTSPNVVPKLAGLSGQLESIEALTANDWTLLLLVGLFEFFCLGLELGPMWVATTRLPSTYAARIALAHYVEVTRLAEAGVRQLGVTAPIDLPPTEIDPPPADPKAPQQTANDNFINSVTLGGEAAVAPRRRGRPPGSKTKTTNGLDLTSSEAHHED